MKTTITFILGATCVLLAAAPHAWAADQAEVSEVIHDVSISGQAANVGDTLSGSAALKTGSKSRAELRFPDTTFLRVGANTVFSFLGNKGGKKEFNLEQGTAFVAAPEKHGGVRVRCGGVTAAIDGCLVTLGWTSKGLFVGVAQETSDQGNAGVNVGGHQLGTNRAAFFPLNPDGTLGEPIVFSYDGFAQLRSGATTSDLPEDLIDLAKTAKIQTFSTNQANNSPSTGKDPTNIDILDVATIVRNIPTRMADDCVRCCKTCER